MNFGQALEALKQGKKVKGLFGVDIGFSPRIQR